MAEQHPGDARIFALAKRVAVETRYTTDKWAPAIRKAWTYGLTDDQIVKAAIGCQEPALLVSALPLFDVERANAATGRSWLLTTRQAAFAAGVSARRLDAWVADSVVAPAHGRDRSARWERGQLRLLRVLDRLADAGLPSGLLRSVGRALAGFELAPGERVVVSDAGDVWVVGCGPLPAEGGAWVVTVEEVG